MTEDPPQGPQRHPQLRPDRAGAVFLIAMSTIGLKSGVVPRWFGRAGSVVGVVLLAWVALVSLYILRRERARRHPA